MNCTTKERCRTAEGRSRRCVHSLAGGVTLALLACSANAATSYGPAVSLEDGTARTYVVRDHGVPTEVGVAIDAAFLAALPPDGAPGGAVMPDGHSVFEYVLEMPEVNPTPFQHVTVNWNPAGHEPPGIYDLAHFDVHFYTISDAERRTIHPGDGEFHRKAERLPGPEFIPAGYVNPGLPPVPMMGLHLVNPASPELRTEDPEPFTHTFVYGVWDGRLIFMEPMITRSFLEQRFEIEVAVPVAERYDPPGFYPGAYAVRWDEASAEYRIALSDLRQR
jgi:hypothetical protein